LANALPGSLNRGYSDSCQLKALRFSGLDMPRDASMRWREASSHLNGWSLEAVRRVKFRCFQPHKQRKESGWIKLLIKMMNFRRHLSMS
jgi:hypothetical protein